MLKPHKVKKENVTQFKDDFSSVKDLKNENNQINESSWIAKLVNGIQDNSLEDLKVNPSKEFQGRYSSEVRDKDEKKSDFQSIKS